MTSDTNGPRGALVSPRVALLSILGFWALYFAIATLRWVMLDYGHQIEMMAARLLVTIGSMLATFFVYLALRPLGNRPLRTNVTAVALLSIPAAIAYSSMNWAAFHQMDKQIEAEKTKAMDEGKIVVDSRVSEAVRQRTEAAISAAREAVAQAAEQAREAAAARREALQAKADALREAKEARRAADAARKQIRQQDRDARDEARRAADEAKNEARRAADEAKNEAKQAAAEARAEARRAAAEARREAAQVQREAAQAQREARQEAQEARREAERQAREEYQNYQQGIQQARDAVEMARRHGITIDLDKMLAGLPAPPAPPAPPKAAQAVAPVPPVAEIAEAPRATPATPKKSAATIAPAPRETPIPAPLPMVTVRIPTLSPDTATIQVGPTPSNTKQDQEDDDYKNSPLSAIADQAMNGYFFFAAWGALFLALSYAAAVRIAEREAARYRAAARDSELRALRYQVNPHFLFNTLNSLSTLVLKDKPDEAEKMILNLSTFFRTSLTADPKEDVTLAEEIRLQRLYLDIEAVRFPERLSVDIQIPETLKNACVPCLILQPLVENAIKYGVSRSKRPVNVKILAREDSQGLVLSVEDDGETIDDKGASKGTGVGLRNVIDRLRARFGDEASCSCGPLPNGGFGVTIFMPLIRDGR